MGSLRSLKRQAALEEESTTTIENSGSDSETLILGSPNPAYNQYWGFSTSTTSGTTTTSTINPGYMRGPQGHAGVQGFVGSQGSAGVQGVQGIQGYQGTRTSSSGTSKPTRFPPPPSPKKESMVKRFWKLIKADS
jgi:hypothetical protein